MNAHFTLDQNNQNVHSITMVMMHQTGQVVSIPNSDDAQSYQRISLYFAIFIANNFF